MPGTGYLRKLNGRRRMVDRLGNPIPEFTITFNDLIARINDVTSGFAAAEVLVGATSSDLDAERLVTDTQTITWDLLTAGAAKADAIGLEDSAGTLVALGITGGLKIIESTGAPTLEFHGASLLSEIKVNVSDLEINNRIDSGHVKLRADNASGTTTTMLDADPDAAAVIYQAGNKALSTQVNGVNAYDPAGTNLPRFSVRDASDNNMGQMNASASAFQLKSLQNGIDLSLHAKNTVGTDLELLHGDADARVDLFYQGIEVLRTRVNGASLNGDGTNVGLSFRDTSDVSLGHILYTESAGGDVKFVSLNDGSTMKFLGDDSTAAQQTLMTLDPDGAAAAYYAGSEALKTLSTGAAVKGSTPELYLYDSSDVERARIRHENTLMRIRSSVNSAEMQLEAYDSATALKSLLKGDPDAGTSLYYLGAKKVSTDNIGVIVESSVPNVLLYDTSATELGRLRHTGTTLVVRNNVNSGAVQLDGKDAVGSLQTSLVADPDAAVKLNYDDSLSLETRAGGVSVWHNTASSPIVEFKSSGGTRLGYIQLQSPDLKPTNEVVSGTTILYGTNASSVLTKEATFDPDAAAKLYYAGTEVFLTRNQGVQVKDPTGGDDPLIQFLSSGNATIAHVRSLNGVMTVSQFGTSGQVKLEANNSLGTANPLVTADPDGEAVAYYAGTRVSRTLISGFQVHDTSGSQPQLIIADDASVQLGRLKHGGSAMTLYNQVDGGILQLSSDDALGTERVLFYGDPDGVSRLYYDADYAIETSSQGASVYDQTTSNSPIFAWKDSALTRRSYIQHDDATAVLGIWNDDTSGTITLRTEDATSTSKVGVKVQAAQVEINHDGSLAMRTQANGINAYDPGSAGNIPRVSLRDSSDTNMGQMNASTTAFQVQSLQNGVALSLHAKNTAGTNLKLLNGNADARVDLFYQGVEKLRTRGNGISVNGDGTNSAISFRDSSDVSLGHVLCSETAGGDMKIVSLNDGSTMTFIGDDAAAVQHTLMTLDPDAAAVFYYDGNNVLGTQANGAYVIAATSPGIGSAQDVRLQMYDNVSTALGHLGFPSSADLELFSANHGGKILLKAEDGAGTARTMASLDPDGTQVLDALTSIDLQIGSSSVLKASSSGLTLNAGPKITSGTGSPESVVTAAVGSLYLRTDGGASTTLYVKESGTGNTGWVAK